MDQKPQKALDTIRSTRVSTLPDDINHQRLLLEARSFAALKQWGDAERSWIEEESLAKGGATAGDDRKMNNEPLEREPIDRVRARSEALLKANAAPRCSTGFSSGCAGCVGSASRGGGGSRFWAWRFPTSTSNRKSSSSAALRTGDTKSFMLHPVRGSVPVTNAATQQ